MIEESEFYRMRSLYETESWKREEMENTLSEICFLVESDNSGNETISRIREVLDDCMVRFPRRDNPF